MAVDTLGHLLALHVTPANADDRAEVGRIAKDIQSATGQSVEVAFVDQGYTGGRAAAAAAEHGSAIELLNCPRQNGASLCSQDDGDAKPVFGGAAAPDR